MKCGHRTFIDYGQNNSDRGRLRKHAPDDRVVGSNVVITIADDGQGLDPEAIRANRNNGRNVVAIRGELVPYVRLREAFAMDGTEPDIEKIVIARHGQDRVAWSWIACWVTTRPSSNPSGGFIATSISFSGATIMGDGRVALILELGGLVRAAHARTTIRKNLLKISRAEKNARSWKLSLG